MCRQCLQCLVRNAYQLFVTVRMCSKACMQAAGGPWDVIFCACSAARPFACDCNAVHEPGGWAADKQPPDGVAATIQRGYGNALREDSVRIYMWVKCGSIALLTWLSDTLYVHRSRKQVALQKLVDARSGLVCEFSRLAVLPAEHTVLFLGL